MQQLTRLDIQGDERIPSVLPLVVLLILPIHSANIRALGVDAAAFAGGIVVPTGAIASVEKTGFFGQMNVLAAEAALGAGEGFMAAHTVFACQ